MPRRVQNLGEFEQQFKNVIDTAVDKTVFVDVTAPGADVEFGIDHGLGFEPVGFIVTLADRATDVYLSATPRTTSMIYLKSSTAGAILRILIF